MQLIDPQQMFPTYPVAASNSNKPMSGVEIHANAIATLMSGKAIAPGINSLPLRGLFVLILVGSTALMISTPKRSLNRFISSLALCGT
ncbi:MAG: hypothetical protein HWQ38_16200 [Nostoc sp. NMS7]|uniref:hypothetical protein n=1 Tax=Nostoc sp. NMS7 TaxID=2815391 RepID=UPI0025E47BC0|nr:hypothetical protein [Nostoc sp. NMS7]MBN3947914.1 hypothetical protein [Nostoc sp. NMS7]